MVFYRKYRPQTISQLDSKQVRDTLTSVLSQKSTPHAFLFTGPKGLGKTSTARIVAKVLNCEKKAPGSVEPCNKCDQCVSITNGTNLDVLEIDAASNRGIDEIRDLREKIRLSPLSAAKKVYIIDEVHMLTTEAFNALLKTLEEPPAHVVFILCTTEFHKVPATILSRCFNIQFTLATSEELKSSFKRIVDSEKIKIDEDALDYIARLSDGSFRDGAKVLEEVMLLADGKNITREVVEEKYKITNFSSSVSSLLEAIQKKDAKKALEIIDSLVKNGSDIKFFIEELIKSLHSVLVTQVTGNGQKSGFTINEIKTVVPLLTKAYSDMRLAPISQLPLELAIIEYCGSSSDEQKVQTVEHPRESAPKSVEVKEKVSAPQAPKSSGSLNIIDLLEQLKKDGQHGVAGLVRGCTIESFDGGNLVLSTKYSYHRERLEDKKTRPILQKAASAVTGKETTVSIVLQTK